MIPRVTRPAVSSLEHPGILAAPGVARAVERFGVAARRRGPCRIRRAPDLFDGRAYTIDEFYARHRGFFDRPCAFYRDFASPGAPALRDVPQGPVTGHGPSMRSMVFDSPVRTEWPENNRVPFKWFGDPRRQARAVLLLVPGWARTSQSFEERMCARLVARGVDAGLLTKPFHQQRAPRGSRSGEYFISANLWWTVANFRQFTAEIRLLVQYMRRRYDTVGIIGMSSGGFQAGMASNCEDIDFLFSIVTGCQLGSITWHGVLTQSIRRELEARGVDEDQLNRAWSMGDQAVLGTHCRARYRKHYLSRYDGVILPVYQQRLWEVYGQPDRMDLPTSHYSTYFFLDLIVDDIAGYVRRALP